MSEGPEATAAPDEDSLVGRTIAGKFVVERLLGAGSMGAVYRAQQVALERTVAIKVIRGGATPDETAAKRFHLEAKAASRLDHPNVIQVFDYGQEPDGLLYIAMEFLECRDLLTVLNEDWPLSHSRLVDILSQTLAALAEAHDAGVFHRDLKPENILLVRRKAEDGTPKDLVKVCDFGIAKMTKGATPTTSDSVPEGRPLTTGGLVVGTPEYMAPEQARGESFDARSDLYAVGVILYQLLTRRLPFEAKAPIEVVFKVMHADPPPLGASGPTAAPGLDAVCSRAMSRRPEDRFQDAREMRAALRGAQPAANEPRGREDNAGAPSAPAPLPKSRDWRRFGALFVAAAVGLYVARRATAPTVPFAPPAPRTASGPLDLSTTEPRAEPEEVAPPREHATPRSPSPPTETPTIERPLPHELRRGTPRALSPEGDASPAVAKSPVPVAVPIAPPRSQVAPSAPARAPDDSSPAPRPPAAGGAPLVAPPTRFDPTSARVDLGLARTNNASATNGSVARALRPLVARFTACYRDAAAQGSLTASEVVGALHLESDEAGYITVAHLTGAVPSSAGACIEAVSRSARIQVDTGTANADVTLRFKPF